MRLGLRLHQVAEVELAVLLLDHDGLEAGNPDAVYDHAAVDERHERHRRVRRVERQELLVARVFREGDAVDLGAEGRPERHLQVAFQAERAAGFLLRQGLDLALVAVGIEGQRENGRPQDQKDQQAHDRV